MGFPVPGVTASKLREEEGGQLGARPQSRLASSPEASPGWSSEDSAPPRGRPPEQGGIETLGATLAKGRG